MKLFAAVLLLSSVAYAEGCEAGWVARPDTDLCYWLSDEAKPFMDALGDCDFMQARITNIEDQAEQDFVSAIAENGTNDVWIDFADISTREGIWKWNSPACVNYTNWAQGEPSYGNGGKDCAILMRYGLYYWNDSSCEDSHNFICKKKRDGGNFIPFDQNDDCFNNCFNKFPAGTCFGANYLNDTCIYSVAKFDQVSNGVNTSYVVCTTELPEVPTTDGPSTTATTAETTLDTSYPHDSTTTAGTAAPTTTAGTAPPTTRRRKHCRRRQ